MNNLMEDVSRETMERLQAYENIVGKWTPKINLVSRDSVKSLWDRHILDSVQVYNAAPKGFEHWVDLGSGGGFPGIVVAILSQEEAQPARITLVESDARKCVFLRTALRETGAKATVLQGRIEEVPRLEADVLSARALADLSTLLGFAERHMGTGGTALFPKGVKWREEVAAAKTIWNFDVDVVTSVLEADAAILSISGVTRV